LFLANDIEGAERILSQVGDNPDQSNLSIWAQVTAELRLAEGNPSAALEVLNRVTSTTSAESAKRILVMRADAFFKLQKPESAVRTLLQREAILTTNAEREASHRLIWTGMQATGAQIPASVMSRTGDPILIGWLQLGHISYANRSSVVSMLEAIDAWELANPDHPASGVLLADVRQSLELLSNYPGRIAVLLPLSGKQQAFGEAIRDGFLAAHFSVGDAATRPDARFYDTATNGISAAYQQAILGGAEFVIGPLLKSEVGSLAAVQSAIPILALNFGPEDMTYPARFYQFALAPEDEARAVANRAADGQLFNAVALVPESAWGDRVLGAFQEELELRGGTLLAARTYAADTTDFADVIRDVLLLDESYDRRRRIASNIGKELEFEPRRRQDVDLVFMAANSATAKLLRPQLRFHYAGDIPTFATSAVYTPGSAANEDINGIVFPDIPWLLQPSQPVAADKLVLQDYWGRSATQLGRFYALGYDAFHLTAQLNSSEQVQRVIMPGMTGEVWLDTDGRLHRRLAWAKIESGNPRTLVEEPRDVTEDSDIIVPPPAGDEGEAASAAPAAGP
jgi:outer membrane PBP1 activator LpoA protein